VDLNDELKLILTAVALLITIASLFVGPSSHTIRSSAGNATLDRERRAEVLPRGA
jgi:hypothetical protein